MPFIINKKEYQKYLEAKQRAKALFTTEKTELLESIKATILLELEEARNRIAKNTKINMDNLKREKQSKIYNASIEKEKAIRNARTEIAKRFPLPKVAVSFERPEENGHSTVSQDRELKKYTFSVEQTKAMDELRTKSRTVLGFTIKKNSQQFDELKDKLELLHNNFSDMNSFGDDLESFKAKAAEMKSLLTDIQEKSNAYLGKLGKHIFTTDGKQRKANVTTVLNMVNDKLEHFDEFVRETEQRFTKQQENRNKDIETATEAADADAKAKIQAAENEYTEKMKEEPVRLKADLQKKKDESDSEIAKEETSINEAIEGFGKVEKYEDLGSKEKQLFMQAQFASTIFDEEHNPFSDYRKTVKAGDSSYDNILDFSKRENAMELDSLKEMLGKTDPKIPVTYTPDAMLTLANLNTMDAIMNMKREKNVFQVEYIFEKDGKIIGAKDLKDYKIDDLAKDGYRCFVTGIKADPLVNNSDRLSDPAYFDSFKIKNGAFMSKDAANALLDYDASMLKNLPGFNDKIGKRSPAEFFAERLKNVQTSIRERIDTSSISDNPNKYIKRYNFTDLPKLKKNIASGAIDFKPICPNKRQMTKKYIKPGITRKSGNYYDQELIENLELNNRNLDPKEIAFNPSQKIQQQLFDQNRLVLSHANELVSKELNDMFISAKGPKPDKELAAIEKAMKEVSGLKADSVFDIEQKYLIKDKNNGTIDVTGQKPGKDDDYALAGDFVCRYDRKASQLYSMVSDYIKNHKNDPTEKADAAKALEEWKNHFDFDGQLVINDKNFASPKKGELEQADAEYLFNAKLFAYDKDFCDVRSTDKEYLKAFGYNKENHEIEMLDVKSMPLFPRRPSLGDIKQGQNGDCYLLSVLSSKAADNPEEIENMIKDNNDGTVTCKLYDKAQQPRYVTVSKKLAIVKGSDTKINGQLSPRLVTGESGPIWFHLLEKAYMLSGIREEYIPEEPDTEKADNMIEQARGMYFNGDQNISDEDIKKTIVQKCYPKDYVDGKYDVAKFETEYEQKFNNLLGKSFYGLDGGHMMDVMTNLSGKAAERIDLDFSSPDLIINAVSKLDNDVCLNALTGDAFKSASNEELEIISSIGKAAGQKLALDKLSYSKDWEGTIFKSIEGISLEDVTNAINNVIQNPKSELFTKGINGVKLDPQKIQDLGKQLCQSIKTKSMDEMDPRIMLVSQQPGYYSKKALSIKETIKKHVDARNTVNCSFSGGTKKFAAVGKSKELEMSNPIESIDDNGAIKGHAFSIVDYREENGKFYISVRNPWGEADAREYVQQVGIGDKTETVSYKKVSFDAKGMGNDGIHEIELNEFMQNADVVEVGEGIKGFPLSQMSKSLATLALGKLKSTNSEKYDKIISDEQMTKQVISQIANDKRTVNAAKKMIEYSTTLALIDAGVNLPREKLLKMDEIKKEINSTFVQPDLKKNLSKDKEAAEIIGNI